MTKPEKVACRNPKEICAQNRKSGLTKHTSRLRAGLVRRHRRDRASAGQHQGLPVPTIDCFDGWPVCWRLSRCPDKAPCSTRSPTWLPLSVPRSQAARRSHRRRVGLHWRRVGRGLRCGHVARPMSRKAGSPSKARCEGFFGTRRATSSTGGAGPARGTGSSWEGSAITSSGAGAASSRSR